MNEDPRPLRLLTLCGSLRAGSLNAALARALPALAPAATSIEPAPPWAAFPVYDADRQAIGFPAEVVALGAAIRAADGIVVVSPEYNYSVPGGLKNALDWLSRLEAQPFAGKPVALQSASPGLLGGGRMQYHLRQVFVFLDARVLNRPEVFVGGAGEKLDVAGSRIVDERTREAVRRQLAAFAAFVRAQAP